MWGMADSFDEWVVDGVILGAGWSSEKREDMMCFIG
jgi:hypothetical protein